MTLNDVYDLLLEEVPKSTADKIIRFVIVYGNDTWHDGYSCAEYDVYGE